MVQVLGRYMIIGYLDPYPFVKFCFISSGVPVRGLLRNDALQTGYKKELEDRVIQVEAARNALEAWYARRVAEELIVDHERELYDDAMRQTETALVSAQGTIKTVRKEIVPSLWLETGFPVVI